jgi:hypothetical protein
VPKFNFTSKKISIKHNLENSENKDYYENAKNDEIETLNKKQVNRNHTKLAFKNRSYNSFSTKSSSKDSRSFRSISFRNNSNNTNNHINSNSHLDFNKSRSNSIIIKDSAISTSKATSKKQKFKILLLIATVSITFGLTWLPAHVIQIWKVVFNSSFPYSESMYIIKFIAHTLSYSNSLLNPFIYVFIGAKFRSHFYKEFEFILKYCCEKKLNHKLNRNDSKYISENNLRTYKFDSKLEKIPSNQKFFINNNLKNKNGLVLIKEKESDNKNNKV